MRLDDHDVRRVPVAVGGGLTLPLPILSDALLLVTLAQNLAFADLVAASDAMRFATDRRHDDVSAARPAVAGPRYSRLVALPPRSSGEWDAEIARTLEQRRGDRGCATLRTAWSASAEGVRSRPETLLRLAIAAAGLPAPVVGFTVTGDGWRATPDLAWPEFGVVLEYEGDHHRTDKRQFAHDVRRFDRYLDVGLSPVRALSPDLFVNPMPLMMRVSDRLRQRGWVPTRRWSLHSVGAFRR